MRHRAGEIPWENWVIWISLIWLTFCGLTMMRVAAIERARPRQEKPLRRWKEEPGQIMFDSDEGRVNTGDPRCCG